MVLMVLFNFSYKDDHNSNLSSLSFCKSKKTKNKKTKKGKRWGIYRALKSDKNTLWVHLETTYLVETENFLLKIL